MTFEDNGRMYVWERVGRLWFKEPNDVAFTLLLDIREEVGAYVDLGLLGFALDPDFRVNGYIYLLYVVDRHYLFNFGTPNYNPNTNEYYAATIGRLTRYTCRASDGFRSVDPASRFILIGATKETGIPMCSETHGVGSLVFGEDGTLLVSCGDGASPNATDIGGAVQGSYAPQALSDGIIKAKEDVGAYRSQLVDSHNGKVLRLDPATGNGVPSNPFFDPAAPNAPRSRVWALGLRNPFRMVLKPESGSHIPGDGRPGVLYIGDVGWDSWESLKIVTGPGQNFGWPYYEGLSVNPSLNGGTYITYVANQDAPNPLYPGGGCHQYFSFSDLLKEDTLDPAGQPPFTNPCNTTKRIPTSIPQFLHTRPVLDWNHTNPTTRTPIYGPSGDAQTISVGAPGSPVSGSEFAGNCSVGGTWYSGTQFPAQYRNTYFHADWGQGWIKYITFDQNDRPISIADFVSGGGSIVGVTMNPSDGSLYYLSFDYTNGRIRKIEYTGNRSPVAAATADKYYGPGPLTIQFSSAGSSDPDGQAIGYQWNFGDGSPISTGANPSHTFSAPAGVPTGYIVTLTVTDSGGLAAQAILRVAVNDTPPNVTIDNPVDGSMYQPDATTTINLTATVTDAESGDSQLQYRWQTLLHHNDHDHASPAETNHVTTTVLSPTPCDGINIYYYRILLTVTDPQGLSTVREAKVFPNCGPNTPPTISPIADVTVVNGQSTGPIAFTIGDAEVAPGNLQLSGSSANTTLIPNSNITFGGSGSNRTVTVVPAAGQEGTAVITVSVSDGVLSASSSFLLTVNGVNTVPTISDIPNQTLDAGQSTGALSFTVSDGQTAAGNLTVSGLSSDPVLVPNANIVFGGSGGNRTVAVTPAAGVSGSATIAVTVNDGTLSASDTFVVTVMGKSGTFSNATAIAIPSVGSGTPYPSTINVSALSGAVSQVTVTLRSFSHTWPSDVDILLVGPGGQKAIIFSDVGGGQGNAVSNITVTLSDSAATSLVKGQPIVSGTYRPTNVEPGETGELDNFPAPAPGGPYGTALATFNGQTANGTWSLYVVDDGAGDQGSIAGGWSLSITTTGSGTAAAPTISDIPDQSTLANTATAAIPFTVNDTDTPAASLIVSGGSSNTSLVPNSNIVFGGSGSNRTVTVTPAVNQTGSTTISVTVSDGTLTASDSFVLTVSPSTTGSATFTNASPITIPSIGAATPYPSTINVSGRSGTISQVTVTLAGLTHTWPSDIDILLVGPGGQKAVIFSDVGGGIGNSVSNINVTLSDSASTSLAAVQKITSGTYRPTNVEPGETGELDSFPSPAPTGPFTSALSVFNGLVANGTWSLYVVDDGPGDQGSISGGWSLTITTTDTGVPASPTISDIADQSTPVSTATGPIAFSVNDADTPATSLVVSGVSSNQTLVPNGNIAFGGSGTNRTVTVSPAFGQVGTATITVTVSDGTSTASDSFVFTVSANTAPTISDIQNQTITKNGSTGALSFTVGDAETAAGSLTVSGSSSNPVLVPNGNIVFGGTGASRTVTVAPATGQIGTATITVSVSDGSLSANDSFLLTVNDPGTFANTGAITIPDIGSATPYPSVINVSGTSGVITQLSVRLNNLNHTFPDDVDMLLVSPAGKKVLLLSDAGGGHPLNSVSLTLSDAAGSSLPNSNQIVSGTFKPTNYGGGDSFPAPAPAGPYSTTLSVFNGDAADGAWKLYVVDDGPGDQGSISGGWGLTISTGVSGAIALANSLDSEPPPTAQISVVGMNENGQLILKIEGEPWEKYTIEYSEDLETWNAIEVVFNEEGTVLLSDPVPVDNDRRFFRAVWRP